MIFILLKILDSLYHCIFHFVAASIMSRLQAKVINQPQPMDTAEFCSYTMAIRYQSTCNLGIIGWVGKWHLAMTLHSQMY